MSRINIGRTVVGGLLAGLVVNVNEFVLNTVVLGEDMDRAMLALNVPAIGNQAIARFVVLGFALGIATIWLYATIRPRFGPGVPTAVIAGVTVWFFAYLYSGAGMVIMQLFPGRLMATSIVWGLFELVIAAIAGAWVYTEV